MDLAPKMKMKRLEERGRHAVTLECSEDMSESELLIMKEWVVAEIFKLGLEMGTLGGDAKHINVDGWMQNQN